MGGGARWGQVEHLFLVGITRQLNVLTYWIKFNQMPVHLDRVLTLVDVPICGRSDEGGEDKS